MLNSSMKVLGVDWGSTSLRTYLISVDGNIEARASSKWGLKEAVNYGFERSLRETAGAMLAACDLVLLCGMVGAKEGWVAAPYCSCPCGPDDLADALVQVPADFADLRIVPGIKSEAATYPDVMRGEETQVLGALRTGGGDGLYVLPGTHSKWVVVKQGRIHSFTTYLTGDAFQALRDHSMLGLQMVAGEQINETAFVYGVRAGAQTQMGGELLSLLFSTRTLGLFDRLPRQDLSSYLSGLLVGAEIAHAQSVHNALTVTLVGENTLVHGYELACTTLGLQTVHSASDVVCHGLLAVAQAAGGC